MAGNTHGCVLDQPARRGSLDATAYIASIYFNQATALLRQGAYGEAETYLREVVRTWPGHAGALNNLGTAIWQQGRVREAEAFYRRALAEAPDDFGVLNNLGNALWEQSRPGEAVDFYRRALELEPAFARNPDEPGGCAIRPRGVRRGDRVARVVAPAPAPFAGGPRQRGDDAGPAGPVGRGDDLVRAGTGGAPDFPEAHRNRAYIWLTHGDYERGWPEHEWRLGCRNHRVLPVPRPQWTGEDLRGRTILLHAEQGYGDVLQFIRFACPVKRGARRDRRLSRAARPAGRALPGGRRRPGLVRPDPRVRRPRDAHDPARHPAHDPGDAARRVPLSVRRSRDGGTLAAHC